jgi:hypothetical protein
MTSQHPITPPAELINQWWEEAHQTAKYDEPIGPLVATRSAQWGADQELEACCEWLDPKVPGYITCELRGARRPKPPGLKEQALQAHERCAFAKPGDRDTIRRALEQLDD